MFDSLIIQQKNSESYWSMMSGDLGDNRPPLNRAMTTTMPDRMTKSVNTAPSPLKIFGNAKKRIRDIFVDVGRYVEETKAFINGRELITISNVSISLVSQCYLDQNCRVCSDSDV